MLAIELGTCRSGRTGSPPRLEACGSRRCFDPPADETLLRGEKAALGDQKTVGCDAQAGMMMKPAPVAALVMAKAELLLELLVIPLDPPARLGNPHEALPRRALGQIGEPVLGWLRFAVWPLDQQPLLRPRLRALRIAMDRADPHGRKARGQLALGSRAPGEAAPSTGGQTTGQCLERHRPMLGIAAQSSSWASATGPRGWRQRPVAGWPDAGARPHAKHVAQAERGDADAERGLIAISRITQDGPHRHAIRYSLTELPERDRRLSLEADLFRHPRLGPPRRVLRPGLRQKQPVSDRQAGMVVGHRQADRYLAVVRLAQLA